jgi:hypothetical protein
MTRKLLVAATVLVLLAACSKADDTTAPATSSTAAASATSPPTSPGTSPGTSDAPGTTTTTSSGAQSFMAQAAKSGLSDSIISCLNGKESDDASFKAVVEAKSNPTLDEAKLAIPIILSCMTKADFAKILIGDTSSLSAAATTCVTAIIVGLSEDDLAGFSANDQATTSRLDTQVKACLSTDTTTTVAA